MKKIFLLCISFLFIGGCSVSVDYHKSVDFGHDVYYRIGDSNICMGSNNIDDFVVRNQVSCDTRPRGKSKILNPESENGVIFIDGVGKLSDENIRGVFYIYEKGICEIRDMNIQEEVACDSYFYKVE